VRRDLLENPAGHEGAGLYQSGVVTAAALGWLAGALLALNLPAAPPMTCAAAALWLGIVTLMLRRRSQAGVAAACALLSFAITSFHVLEWLEGRWPEHASGDRVLAEAVVESIPVDGGDVWSFDAIAQGVGNLRVISRDRGVLPRAGERWQLLLALRPPRAPVNPGALDLEQHYFRARIHALATVVPSRMNRRVSAGHRPLTQLREAAARRIDERVEDPEASALIQALAVGATGEMSTEQWRVFNATGTSHLVAISGLHVTMFATVAFFVSRRFWSGLLWRWLPWPRDNVAAAIAFAAALAYAMLAGLSVPTQRTLIMLGAWLLARSLARVVTPLAPMALALLAVLLLDPFAPLAAGFWLSFAAMGAIILVTEPQVRQRSWWRGALAVQLAVTAALTPLTLAWFGSFSAISLVTNAVAIPAVSGVFVPAILLALALMPAWCAASDAVLQSAAYLHAFGWPWLVAAADWPAAMLHLDPPGWWYGLAALAVGASLMPLPVRLRLAALVWLLPLAVSAPERIPEGGMKLTVLDVGRGTAVVVQTASHVLIYGTGESYGTEGRIIGNVLLPFLRSEGIVEIDALVLPHPTSVTSLLAELPVARTSMDCGHEAQWTWDEVTFRIHAAGERCALQVIASNGAEARMPGEGAIRVAAGPWLVVNQRRLVRGRDPSLQQRPEPAPATHLLASDEAGAIAFLFDPERDSGTPQAMRVAQPKLWRLPP
jgi:competence protein ComEC